jgi:hypothetical protein
MLQNFPETAIFLEELPASSMDFDIYEVILWIGDPPDPGLFAYPLGQEQIQVVVHLDNPVGELSQTDIRNLFSGSFESWEKVGGDSTQLSVWVYPPENEIQRLFSELFMQGEEFSPFARLAYPAAMIEAVSGDPNNGLLPSTWAAGELKTVRLDDLIILYPGLLL